ncbi:hypothetical protein RD1_3286 [Roseobacter denitrificans OCh 114]|uniref:Uncharacterized protein n=1 Tax=Roseobacter denitrificans (strain ATCC 33942 / OCh 114) TaxID=375451 RepID=Q163Q6_ROSDO|nr:hypothetical protein RD1_3286 [Roseobacter denitrificans OCh 114]
MSPFVQCEAFGFKGAACVFAFASLARSNLS